MEQRNEAVKNKRQGTLTREKQSNEAVIRSSQTKQSNEALKKQTKGKEQ